MSIETDAPTNLLDAHPETAYFWGRVIGDGGVTTESVTVRTNDEVAADRLAAIAGSESSEKRAGGAERRHASSEDDRKESSEKRAGGAERRHASNASIDHRTEERDYAHDTSITRTEDTYTVQLHGPIGDRAAAAFGLPLDGGSGGYRLDALADHDRQLLRGLLEGCGTVCFKSSSGTVGISFVHDDRKLLERVRGLLESADVDAPCGELSETSSGGYWFGIDDAAAPAVGEWLYEDSDATELFAPSRRRKLQRSVEEAEAY